MSTESPSTELQRIKRMLHLMEQQPDNLDEEQYNALVQRHNDLIDIVDPDGLIF